MRDERGKMNFFIPHPSSFIPIFHLCNVAGPGLTKRPPTACRHVVSGSLSSPGRGSSHLSLALLGSLSVAREYLALRDGPRRFKPAFTCPVLLRCQTGGPSLPRTGLSPAMEIGRAHV